jgi:spoIIIJ-associated protein
MLNEQELLKIQELVEGFLKLMNFKMKAELDLHDEDLEIDLIGNDRAYLITDEGETILSLQYMLAKLIRHSVPAASGLEILLDTDGYMYRHEERLRRLAWRTVEQVRNERRRIKLPPLSPYDRRIVHMEIAQNADLDSVSEGEGFFKKIVVQRKNF